MIFFGIKSFTLLDMKCLSLKTILIFFVFCVLNFSKISAQEIRTKIENYNAHYPVERVHIHFDKSKYAPGDTIWFKAYIMSELMPTMISKSFYIDWIDEKGRLIKHTISPILDGAAIGQFALPDSVKGAALSVKAYTRLMLNYDAQLLYYKSLPLITKAISIGNLDNTLKPILNFFPEGGDAVVGLNTRMAFKVEDQWGRPQKIKGAVFTDKGKFVDSLRVTHNGMGKFQFVPEDNTKYIAKWTDERKAAHTTSLPEIKKSGATIQVNVIPGRRSFEVQLSKDILSANDSVFCVGTMYQNVVFIARKSTSQSVNAMIPISDLPYGILTITVFDKQWKPLTERITYIHNANNFILPASFDVKHWGLSHRAKNEVEISVPDSIASNLSIAVTDLGIGYNDDDNILSELMLTADLKGKVYQPSYYFTDINDMKQNQLDLVMLTNGWRRFNWEKLVDGKLDKLSHPIDSNYISLSGKVIGVMPAELRDGAQLRTILTESNGKADIAFIPVDPQGNFNDAQRIFFDTLRVNYALKIKGSTTKPVITFLNNKLAVPPLGNYWKEKLLPDTTGNKYHLALAIDAESARFRAKNKVLEEIIVKTKTKAPIDILNEKYASGLFRGDAKSFDLVNDKFAMVGDVFTFLTGKVAGLQISGQGSNTTLNWRGAAPALYVDEMQSDVSMVAGISLTDIAYVKVFNPPFLGSFGGANGAIAIYTKRGDDIQRDNVKSLNISLLEGYNGIKEFFSPKYYSREKAPDEEKDVRTTLYWNPNIIIDPRTQKAKITFYNNDISDAFRVIIEGSTLDGRLIYINTTME